MNKKLSGNVSDITLRVTAVCLYVMSAATLWKLGIGAYMMNADTTVYLSLAKLYADGHFFQAVNAYWGPLSSMLLAPLLLLGLSPLAALNFLGYSCGAISLYYFDKIAARSELDRAMRTALVFSAAIALLYAKPVVTDALLLCLLLGYCNLVFNASFPRSLASSACAGFLAGLAFLAKSYAFPFFLVHFCVCHLLHYLAKPSVQLRNALIKSLVVGLTCWALVCALRIGSVSLKYGRITMGDSNQVALNALNPDVKKKSEGQIATLSALLPDLSVGLHPPGPGGLTPWEEPISESAEFHSWSIFASLRNFIHFLKLVLTNVNALYVTHVEFSTLQIPALFAAIFLCLAPFGKVARDQTLLFPLVSVMIFPIGYLMRSIEGRYVWFDWILLHLLAAIVLARLIGHTNPNVLKRTAAAFFLFLTFSVFPLKKVLVDRHAQRSYFFASKEMEACGIKGNIASSDNFFESSYFALYLEGHYFGVPSPGQTSESLESDLKRLGIQHFVLWYPATEINRFAFLKKYRALRLQNTEGLMGPASVFSLGVSPDKSSCDSYSGDS